MKIPVPADVPSDITKIYEENYSKATHDSGRLMLFAGDQKIEHLNKDFYGEGIAKEDNDPEHLFKIASQARVGVFASQLGLIARYGRDYSDVPYLVKMNSKTNLVKTSQSDPLSTSLYDMEQVAEFKENSGLDILGIGYTIYFGSEFEATMLSEAAHLIYEAHQYGMIAVIWGYPRGQAVTDETDPHLVAGAAGAAATLGADFVKVNVPKVDGKTAPNLLKEAVSTAGKTKVVCSGGSSKEPEIFLEQLHEQIFQGGTMGNATGRNIHQKSLDEAVRFANAISAITIDGKSVEEAKKVWNSK